MQQADQTASIADGLLVPDDLFARPVSLVVLFRLVFLHTESLVRVGDGEDEEERIGGAWHEGQQLRLVDAENIMERQLPGQPQIVHQRRHDVGVVFWRDSEQQRPLRDMVTHPGE